MGFDFFGADIDMKIVLPQGVQLNPGRYSTNANGEKVANPEDPDVITVGYKTRLGISRVDSSVTIVTSDGSDVQSYPLGFFRSMMTSFQMELGVDQLPKLQVEIEPSSNDLALAMLNSNLFAFANGIAVKFGYTKSPSESFPGRGTDYELFMMMKPEVRFGDSMAFTILGQGMGLTSSQRVQRAATYPGQSPSQIVGEIARRAGLRVEVIGSLGAASSVWTQTSDKWSQLMKTDWAFLREVMDSIPGKMSFRVEGDVMMVFAMSEALNGTPKAVFKWGHAPKLSAGTKENLNPSDVLPILNFGSDTTLAFLPMAAVGVSLNAGVGRDAFSRALIPGAVAGQEVMSNANGTNLLPALAPTTNAAARSGQATSIRIGAQVGSPFGAMEGALGGMSLVQASTDTPSTKAYVQNYSESARFAANWNIEITTLGVPTLRPGDLIMVEGFETLGTSVQKLNGKFMVMKIVHTIDSQGFESRITALRNGTPGEGVPVNGPVNIKQNQSSRLSDLEIPAIPVPR